MFSFENENLQRRYMADARKLLEAAIIMEDLETTATRGSDRIKAEYIKEELCILMAEIRSKVNLLIIEQIRNETGACHG